MMRHRDTGRPGAWVGRWARATALAVLLGVLVMARLAAGGEPPAAGGKGTVSMEFRDTDLATVLRAICRGAGVDFVLDPAVKGKVTAKLQNTSWQDALTIVLASHGLDARREGNTLIITPKRPDAAAPKEAQQVTVVKRPDGTVDVDASGADAGEALRRVATAAGLSLVTAKEVTGKVTASLRGVSANDALDALADSVGARVLRRGRVVRIVSGDAVPEAPGAPVAPGAAPPKAAGSGVVTIERLADGRLNVHAQGADVRDVLARLAAVSDVNVVPSAKLQATISIDLQGVQAQDALAALATQAGFELRPVGGLLFAEPLPPEVHTEAFRLRIADAKEIGEVLKMSIAEAKIAVVAAHNLVVVTGTARDVETARKIVEQVEIAPAQVTISTIMVETNLTDSKNKGVQWSDYFSLTATCPKMPHTFPFGEGEADAKGNATDYEYGFMTCSGLTAVLNFLEQDSSTRTVARPQITTLENQKAKINMVTKFPIATYQVSTETGVLMISGFEYQEFGTILEVTPRVHDGHIIMTVHPEVSRQSGTTTFANADLPVIVAQETTTQVRIKDGDTLVIAGLIRDDTFESNRRVPWFCRIPLIGRFFRNREARTDQRRHLLIFITPRIVKDADFARDAKRKQQHTTAAERDEENPES